MKRFRKYIIVNLLIVWAMPILQSCIGDDSKDYATLFTIGTIEVIEGKDYYFALDDGTTMYPSDTIHINNYKLVDGQRVFIHFVPLEEKKAGYDYNVSLIQLENILTKDIIPLTVQTADSIGNDRINIAEQWITGNYLNIEYQYYHSNNPTKKHMLNLVINETPEAPAEESDYINLEFRHNAYNDNEMKAGWGVVSFRLDKVKEQMEGKKGFRIYTNSIYDGQRYYTLLFDEKR